MAKKTNVVVAMKETKTADSPAIEVTIPEVKREQYAFPVKFNAPLVMNAFGKTAKEDMIAVQQAGSSPIKKKALRKPKDFQRLFDESRYVSTDGWDGVPSEAFRGAMVSACTLVNYKMTLAKQSIRIIPDGYDKETGDGLIKILDVAALLWFGNGVVDVRARAMYLNARVVVTVNWDATQFSFADITNLLARAGLQVGVCAGRPLSKKSGGCGWGTWDLE